MPVGNPWLPIVTRGAEPKKGGGIVQARIADQKVYHSIPNDRVRAGGNEVATGCHIVINLVFFIILAIAAGVVIFPQKTPTILPIGH